MYKLVLPLVLFLLMTSTAHAIVFKSKKDMLNKAQVTEPHPSQGDISLPMPGGLHMSLRYICLPASGYLDAAEIQYGVHSGTGSSGGAAEDRGQYAEQLYTLSFSAPFELENLPAAWGKDNVLQQIQNIPACAAGKNGLNPYVYFIGKYEVSRAQWRAVMNPPEEGKEIQLEENDYLPMTGISWFDALDFTRRYSEWLMQHHPEYLPVFTQEKRSSFIRIPSEAEWEYAARGGHMASPAERSGTTLHPIPEGEDYREYIVSQMYDATLSNLAPIGSRKPNPLGLYDMLGNCSEIIFSPFQLVAGGRPIGGYGGFVIKGGSWRATSPEELHPGHRLEANYYVDGKAQTRDDLGFRVALGSILTPRERRDTLYQEWKDKSTPKAAGGSQSDDVRVVIREVAKDIENLELRKRLERAESVASLYHEKVNENEERMMRETLVGALFSLETIANYGSRCYQLVCLEENYLEQLDTLKKAYDKRSAAGANPQGADMKQLSERISKFESELPDMQKEIRGFTHGIHGALFYYLEMVRASSRFDTGRLLPQLEKVSVQFSHDDGFSRSMTRRVSVLRKHLERKTSTQLGEDEAVADILPDWLLEKINSYW